MKKLIPLLLLLTLVGCTEYKKTSDDIQREDQERILAEGTAQTGMPAIKNFRERKILKDIIELRDQGGLVTYTYLENEIPKEVPGKTALGGKLTFLGETIGFGIPYATQYTSPQKIGSFSSYGVAVLPQADPNGLFSPSSAEGTWVMMLNKKTDKAEPQYVEPRIAVFTFKLPTD